MIKFFRNIRKKLAAENKSIIRNTNYFKYAIGEIFLVVVGILIALQVNNWNHAFQARKAERELIKNLVVDLQSDVKQLTEIIETNERRLMNMDSLLQYAGTDINSLESQSLLYLYARRSIMNYFPFNNQNRTMEKLSNNEIEIGKREVRDSIAYFQQHLIALNGQTDSYRNAIFAARPTMFKLFKYYQFTDSIYVADRKWSGKEFSRLNEDIDLQDEFFNYLASARGITRNYISEYWLKGHLRRTENLITLLKNEYQL